MPDVTIFIRTFNEQALIEECLSAIYSQKTNRSFQVIILDSSSTDKTIELACKFPLTIYQIPKAIFTYASALNFGASKAQGKYIMFLSGHAIPIGSDWLEQLVSPLDKDLDHVASYSRQIGWNNLSANESSSIAITFPEQDAVFDAHALIGPPPPYEAIPFSNVSSCFKIDYLRSNLFYELPFAEDRMAALQAVSTGKNVLYCAKSVVRHSHAPDLKSFFKIAYNASIAQAAINDHFFWAPRPFLNFAQCTLKLAAYQPIVLATICARTLGLKSAKLEFLHASFGTCLGKWQASLRPIFKKQLELKVADCSHMLNSVMTIKQC